MKPLDEQSKNIVRELVLQPRISDNQISKKTGIPLKTVNRKRKKMEAEGHLRFYTHFDLSPQGTGLFKGRDLYIVTFKEGITKDIFMSGLARFNPKYTYFKHIRTSYLAEKDGRVVLTFILESHKDTDLIEIFNADIVPDIHSILGKDSIHKIETLRLDHQLNLLHNYIIDETLKKKFPNEEAKRKMTFVYD
jgi:DNA-binding Lrp family transcriptional regulator